MKTIARNNRNFTLAAVAAVCLAAVAVGAHADEALNGVPARTVHYADAYTSYGPIVDAGDGVTYLTVRARPDSGPKYMPESRSQRPTGAGGRQLTALGDLQALEVAPDGTAWLLGPFSDGLAVRLARLGAGQLLPAAQPAGDGTVYLLLEGALDGPGQDDQALRQDI